jgi:hypothetical protein
MTQMFVTHGHDVAGRASELKGVQRLVGIFPILDQ